jgi:hypothetical protein
MNSKEKEKIIYQIITGKITIRLNNKKYYCLSPNAHILYEASQIYEDIIEENKYSGWKNKNQLLGFLMKKGILSLDTEKNIRSMEKRVEDLKVGMYKTLFDATKREKLRIELHGVRNKLYETYSKKSMLDHITVDGLAECHKTFYIFSQTIYDENDNLIYDENSLLLEPLINKICSNYIDEPSFREIARTEPWRSYWSSQKEAMFDGLPSKEQRTLIMYSRMYDNALEHPECPSDTIIEDDDTFDGWMISLRRDSQKGKQTSEVESMLGGKHKNASEVFIMAGSQDDANKIYDHNDLQAKTQIAMRGAQIKHKGTVEGGDFVDQKLTKQMQANNQFKNAAKGKK